MPKDVTTLVLKDVDIAPKRGERWDSFVVRRTCRVMADPIEGYVMARYKGAMPFLVHLSDWFRLFRRKPAKWAKGSRRAIIGGGIYGSEESDREQDGEEVGR